MDPLDPNQSFLQQLTEPDPTYIPPLQYPHPQLFASQQSNKVANQLVAPCDYLQVQRDTLAQRINSARLENTFAPPSAQAFSYTLPVIPSNSCTPSLSPQRYSYEFLMDKRHPSSFQQLEKVYYPSSRQWLHANYSTAGRGYLCHCILSALHDSSSHSR